VAIYEMPRKQISLARYKSKEEYTLLGETSGQAPCEAHHSCST